MHLSSLEGVREVVAWAAAEGGRIFLVNLMATFLVALIQRVALFQKPSGKGPKCPNPDCSRSSQQNHGEVWQESALDDAN